MEYYPEKYSKKDFWSKVKKVVMAAGEELIEKALTLYYCLRDPATPGWVKGMIIGALGYFIFPGDAVPDCLLGLGYTDDLGVLAGVYITISPYITDEHIEKTKNKIKKIFKK